MALREDFERFGNWLFRWRSYLPLLLSGLFLLALLKRVEVRVENVAAEFIWEMCCLAVSLFGLGVRMHAAACAPRGSSGRNVKEQRATALNTTGLYSVTRNPLYLGNFFIWVGAALFVESWWLAAVTALIFWLYYEKIMFAEEEFLREKFGTAFLEWARETPVFFPRDLSRWRPPDLSFEIKNALRREYSGFFAIISVFSSLKLLKDSLARGAFVVDPVWLFLFSAGLAVYAGLLWVKKKTHWLDVAGR